MVAASPLFPPSTEHAAVRYASGRRNRRRALARRSAGHGSQGPADLGAIRPGGDRPRAHERKLSEREHETLWRYRELLPYFDESRCGLAGRADEPAVAVPAAGSEVRPRQPVDQGRVATADGQLQVSRHGAGDHHGQAARRQARRPAHRRQRRRRGGGLRGTRRHGMLRLHARGHAGRQSVRVPAGRSEDVSGQRADQRLRPDRPRGQSSGWAGSTSRRSRSRIAWKAKRRWAWSWPSNSTGNCPT